MKAYLMFKDKNLKVDLEKSYNSDITLRDMEIQEIVNLMASKDELIKKVVTYCFLNPLRNHLHRFLLFY